MKKLFPLVVIIGTALLSGCCKDNGVEEQSIENGGSQILVKQSVDLGLSVLWATTNVGAATPEENGDYFAWGETTAGKKNFNWNTYKFGEGPMTGYSEKDGLTVLAPGDDAATQIWGEDWRMPSSDQFQELLDKCTWTYFKENGVEGYWVQSNIEGFKENRIFLPSAGYFMSMLTDMGLGHYWSSTLSSMDEKMARVMTHTALGKKYVQSLDRYFGCSVRPVSDLKITGVALDSTSLSIYVKKSFQLTAHKTPARSAASLTWTSSDESVATVDGAGNVTGISEGTCIITVKCQNSTAQCNVTVRKFIPKPIDLGLSVKWASCNLGAFTPEETGDYYAWGEVETKSVYDWTTYFDTDDDGKTFRKYTFKSDKTQLAVTDDAAYVNLGGQWYMPTEQDFRDLENECDWIWFENGNSEFGGLAGYKVMSRDNDNFIFLPAAGNRIDDILQMVGEYGSYWTSSFWLNPYEDDNGWSYDFGHDYKNTVGVPRNKGYTIRPVCK